MDRIIYPLMVWQLPFTNQKIIPNNFIKILVDTQIDYKKFESVINSLFLLKPLELSNDFRDNGGTATTIDMNHAYVSLDTKSLLSEYVQNLDLNVSKEKLMAEILAIYDKASNNLKIASIEVWVVILLVYDNI